MRARIAAALLAVAVASTACATAPPATATAAAVVSKVGAPVAVSPRDIRALPLPTALEMAPGGGVAVLALDRPSASADAYVGELWAVDLADGTLRRFSEAGVSSWHPKFSRDGRELAWLTERDEATELVVASWPGGRARAVFAGPEGIEGFDWAPDGRSFVLVRPDPRPAGTDEDSPIRITRSLAQSDGAGLHDGRRSHLWRIERASGRATPITSGDWDDSEPAFAPDGRWIAFVSNRHPDPDATDDTDLFLVRPDGTELRRLATGPGPDTRPVWSHRGDRIAYLSVPRPNDYYQPTRLATIAPEGGAPRDLTGALDAWVAADSLAGGTGAAAPRWSADDAALWVPIERRGTAWIAAIPSSGGAPREVAGGAAVHGLVRPQPGGGIVFSRTTATTLPELWTATADGSDARPLTSIYAEWRAARRLVEPVKVSATNPDGDEVEAWLYPPLDPEAGAKHPLIVYIHGGPQGFDGDWFDFDLENQLFPAHGWGVLRVNYRGSTSYGEAFSRAIWGDWHRREHDDLMAALDAAIAAHPWIDPARLGIGGWSYGGIMTLWTVGHTDRFAVGVPERFSFDYLSTFGEDQWWVWLLTELGSPLENEERYRRLSPGTYLENVRTPLYLIANEQDRNCPLPQVLQAYQRLKLMGQETELVVYPGAAHSLSRPSHLVDRLERLLDWYGRHLD
ncbi:MAG: hypothetical protein AMXMBFR36_32330 [Acidobacteriota bacterium]